MQISICTLFEKNYHYGVGVLFNSLYSRGFRGVFWAGYRGNLPDWADSCVDKGDYQELSVSETCAIRFVKLTTEYHLTNHKPSFMLEVLESLDPSTDALFYFDPDIVNKCDWNFYEQWVTCGVALCEDQYSNFSTNHPKRVAWKKTLEQKEFGLQRSLDKFYNAGCVGVSRDHKYILMVWEKLLDECIDSGYLESDSLRAKNTFPYLYDDQCVLNASLMLTTAPVSSIGPEGMDFGQGGELMSHAVGPIAKPWQRKYLSDALQGFSPRLADKVYWENTQSPLIIHTSNQAQWKRLALKISSLITYFFRRIIVAN